MTTFEEGRLVNSVRHVALPGTMARRRKQRFSYDVTPQSEINKCLSCPFTECRNCMENRSKNTAEKLRETMALLKANMSVNDACKAAGISRGTYYRAMAQFA